jgi:hypothetical protein
MTDLSVISTQAAQILRNVWGTTVSLVEPRLLKNDTRCAVIRCRVAAPQTDIASVIIKHIRKQPQLGFSAWASLAFCADIPAVYHLVPRFLGGSAAERLFVMSDLGGSRTLEDVLRGTDRRAAQRALTNLAQTMAQLHAATVDMADHFEHHRLVLPFSSGLGRHAEAQAWLNRSTEITAWFAALNRAVPTGFTACLARIADTYRNPGPFLCFSHGDPAPTNNHIAADGRVRLLDFEYGAFRHALYDLTAWNVLCPLPRSCVRHMNNTYRRILAQAIPVAADDAQYALNWACLCAYRALAMLTWIKPGILQENQPWADDRWTSRQAVLAAVIRLQEAAANLPALAPAYEAALLLREALTERWSEYAQTDAVIPPWRAFADEMPRDAAD